jgi:integrase
VFPRDLRTILGKYAHVVSLNTTDYETAKARCSEEAAKVNAQIARARLTLTNHPDMAVEKIARSIAKDTLRGGLEYASEPGDANEGAWLYLTDELERLSNLANVRALTVEEKAQKRAYEILLRGPQALQEANEGPTLSTVFEQYKTERNPGAGTWMEFQRALDVFVEIVGDLPVRSIRKEHIRTVKATLLATKTKRGAKMSPATVQKVLVLISAVLSWANREGITESNVAAGGIGRVASLNGTADTGDKGKRPFTVEQVSEILAKLPDDGPMCWLWLLGLYSGARINEIAGLRKQDIREVDGVLCMVIEPHEGRSLKNRSSRRMIPIHSAIIKAGFTADLLPFPSSGHYYSKRVNPWLRKVVGIADPKLSYHSGRHSFIDACRRAGIPEEVHDALSGHTNGSVSRGYGRGVPVSVLKEAIERIAY